MINKLEYQKIEQLLSVNIVKTMGNLKIAVAWFTNPNLFTIVLQLLERDIEVELILCNEDINFINPKINYDQFIAANGKLYVGNPSHLMHNKFCIIDDRYLINGSYNWTLKAEKSNHENVVLTDNLNLVNDFKSYFEYLKTKTDAVAKVNLLKTSSTISEIEKQAELELISKVEIIKIPAASNPVKEKHNKELTTALEKAELLYYSMKHEECIAFCKFILEKNTDVLDLYYWISIANWRLDNAKEQIKYAQKAINLDNQFYDAYNLLGMGYTKLGEEQNSKINYDNCISNDPDEYTYYRNRSIAFQQLQKIPNMPKSLIESHKRNEIADLKKILQILNEFEDLTYHDMECSSYANYHLGNIQKAKDDIAVALDKYAKEQDKFLKDQNVLKDMKSLQKDILKYRK